jgi:hypothetical protein
MQGSVDFSKFPASFQSAGGQPEGIAGAAVLHPTDFAFGLMTGLRL